MQVVQSPRASAILYHVLKSRLDVRPWLLPANICPIVPNTFLKAKIDFELVDISAETLHMDLEQAESFMATGRFGGILYAHTYGESSTPETFFRHIKRLDESILIVDDRCLCVPGLQANPASLADVQLYSTGYAKFVDLGIGGYAFLEEKVPYKPVNLFFDAQAGAQLETLYKAAIRNREKFAYEDSDWLQTNSMLTSWSDYRTQVAEELENSRAQRSKLNAIYESLLPSDVQFPSSFQNWRFNIRVSNKSRILHAIFGAGLFASSHYASLAGIMTDGMCPDAEVLHDSVINLFNDHHFDEAKAEKVCEVILQNLS